MSIEWITCPFCHTAFHPTFGMQMAQCPQCHSQFPNTHAQPLDLASLMARKQALEADRVKMQQKLAQVRHQFCQRNKLSPEYLDQGESGGKIAIQIISLIAGSLALMFIMPRHRFFMYVPFIVMFVVLIAVVVNTMQRAKIRNAWIAAQFPYRNRIYQAEYELHFLSQQMQQLETNNPVLPLE